MFSPNIKCVFILLNSFSLVVGLLFTGLGVMLAFVPEVTWKDFYENVKENAQAGYSIPESAAEFGSVCFFQNVGVSFLVFGGFLSFASFLAYLGAGCKAYCCRRVLLVYCAGLVTLLVFETIVGVMLYVADSPIHDKLKSGFQSQITDEYKQDGIDSFSRALNAVHQYYDCCGMEGDGDFGAKPHQSCDTADEKKGCYTKLQSRLEDNVFPLALAVFCALQLTSLYCAIFIYKQNVFDNSFVPMMSKVRPIKPFRPKPNKVRPVGGTPGGRRGTANTGRGTTRGGATTTNNSTDQNMSGVRAISDLF